VRGVIFAILASFVWGLAPIFFKLGLRAEVSNLFALIVHNFSAFLLASLLFFALGEPLKAGLRELVFISVGGMLSGFLGLFLYFEAVRHGKVSIVAPIASTSPLWSVFFAYVLLGEGLNLQKLVGVFLIVVGITLLNLSKQ
jgi:bacterial/archaeal transporter family protein